MQLPFFSEGMPVSVSMEDWRMWRGLRNGLPNLHLLEGRSNDGKSDMRLVDYHNDMNNEQKVELSTQTIILEEVSLEIEDLDSFYETRKHYWRIRYVSCWDDSIFVLGGKLVY